MPSAAALLKRARKDGALPRISPLVDACNAISLHYGIPIGGEDLARIIHDGDGLRISHAGLAA